MKNLYSLLPYHFAIIICICPLHDYGQRTTETIIRPSSYNSGTNTNANTAYRILPAGGNTYVYEIAVNGKTVIKQLTIPTKHGNTGFASKEDAGKVAELVIQKIAHGEMPPTVSAKELKTLHINF